ncbi:GGDEF, diguanylate cyclase (GGDEF) domain [Candidatus Nanopelagicaceae bacterium]|jgi:GGDEF domain-containing protein
MTFSHDGLRDSLTHLAAPPYFYENLRRELGTADRNKSELSLIRFLISKNATGIQNTESESESEQSQYEVAILSFAEILKASIRSEDLCARLGQLEFTLILKGSSNVAISLAERVLRSWMLEGFRSHYSVLTVIHGESSLEILNRLDNQELRLVTKG